MVGINSFESSINLGSDQTDLRPAAPLFQVQPSGCPFITHKSNGFCSWSEDFRKMFKIINQNPSETEVEAIIKELDPEGTDKFDVYRYGS